MLTEETIQNMKQTIDQTLMNLFHINQEQLRVSEDADYNLDLFDYTINAPGHIPQFFSVSIENHPLMKPPKYTIITTTDHKLENDTWWIHNPSNIVNSAPIPVNVQGEISPQFYETLANQLGLAYFAKQELEPKAIPRLLSVQPGCYTEIEPIDTKVPLDETNLTLVVWDEDDRLNAKLTVPSSVWLERDGYTKNTYPIEHYVYDTDQEQFRLYAQHIGDPTATEVERRKNTQFYNKLHLQETASLRFPFHSPEDFATQANHALLASKTPTANITLDNNPFRRAVELFNSSKVSGNAKLSEPDEPENEPSL
jgi:hypothetical protein